MACLVIILLIFIEKLIEIYIFLKIIIENYMIFFFFFQFLNTTFVVQLSLKQSKIEILIIFIYYFINFNYL